MTATFGWLVDLDTVLDGGETFERRDGEAKFAEKDEDGWACRKVKLGKPIRFSIKTTCIP